MGASFRFYVYTEEPEYNFVEKNSKKYGVTMSSYIRTLILEKMNEPKGWNPRVAMLKYELDNDPSESSETTVVE